MGNRLVLQFGDIVVVLVGLAQKKTVTIQPAGKDQGVLLATTKSKKQSKPSSVLNKSIMKKEFHRMAKAVSNQVLIVMEPCLLRILYLCVFVLICRFSLFFY